MRAERYLVNKLANDNKTAKKAPSGHFWYNRSVSLKRLIDNFNLM